MNQSRIRILKKMTVEKYEIGEFSNAEKRITNVLMMS